jgi:hypothetical protein
VRRRNRRRRELPRRARSNPGPAHDPPSSRAEHSADLSVLDRR